MALSLFAACRPTLLAPKQMGFCSCDFDRRLGSPSQSLGQLFPLSASQLLTGCFPTNLTKIDSVWQCCETRNGMRQADEGLHRTSHLLGLDPSSAALTCTASKPWNDLPSPLTFATFIFLVNAVQPLLTKCHGVAAFIGTLQT